MRAVLLCLLALWLAGLAPDRGAAEPLTREALAAYVYAPFALGEEHGDSGIYALLNSGGTEAGYVFETEPLAPLPGFSGAPINMLVTLDLEGRFLDVRLLTHNEPIFVSGLGEAPFHQFFEQYGGLSLSDSIVVGTPYGQGAAGSSLVYLDGVTKATASVRIAHESVMAAALAVAREKMQGIAVGPPAHPDPDHDEALSWEALVAQGIARNLVVRNAEVDTRFAGTIWADDDPEATEDPEGLYLDLWVVDLGPPAIARAVLSGDTYEELQRFLEISDNDEPILVIDRARHGLVSPDFVRNTAPDRLAAHQDGLPVALRDADLFVDLAPGVPDGTAMILRTDRRLGFDPSRDWTLEVLAVREHGMFQPEVGSVIFEHVHATPERFFFRPEPVRQAPPWLTAIRDRQGDLVMLGLFLAGLLVLLGPGERRLAGHPQYTAIRLGVLAFVVGFVGFWGQGQLSMATVLGAIRTAAEGGSFVFLLYEPFALAIWTVAIVGFALWGRGLFCGWLCPFGALQEFAHHLGKALRLRQIEPSAAWDLRLKGLKYVLLAGLVAVVFLAPDRIELALEIEPFKTAITTSFQREWYYVAYAAFWLGLGLVTFKGFCRYVCPLGAVMAIGGLLRGRDWIARRSECGSPCQFCRVRCKYGAIAPTGEIRYGECFQCLDCVRIHDNPRACVPQIIAARRDGRRLAAE